MGQDKNGRIKRVACPLLYQLLPKYTEQKRESVFCPCSVSYHPVSYGCCLIGMLVEDTFRHIVASNARQRFFPYVNTRRRERAPQEF